MPKLFEITKNLAQKLNRNAPQKIFLCKTGTEVTFEYSCYKITTDILQTLTDSEIEAILAYAWVRGSLTNFAEITLFFTLIYLVFLVPCMYFSKKISNSIYSNNSLSKQEKMKKSLILTIKTILVAVWAFMPTALCLETLILQPYFLEKWDLQAAEVLDDPEKLIEAHEKYEKLLNWGPIRNFLVYPRKISKEKRAEYLRKFIEENKAAFEMQTNEGNL